MPIRADQLHRIDGKRDTEAAVTGPNRRMGLLLGGLVVLATTACGGGGNASPTAAGSGRTITIEDFEFSPLDVQAKVGDTISVVNKDAASHSLTAEDKAFDTGPFGQETKTFTVSAPGRYSYFCTVHPYMPKGVIQVSS